MHVGARSAADRQAEKTAKSMEAFVNAVDKKFKHFKGADANLGKKSKLNNKKPNGGGGGGGSGKRKAEDAAEDDEAAESPFVRSPFVKGKVQKKGAAKRAPGGGQ